MIRALVCWLIIAADFFRRELSDRRVVADRNGFLIARDSVDMALARDVDGAFVLAVPVDAVRATPPLVPETDDSLLVMLRYIVALAPRRMHADRNENFFDC